MKKLSAIPENLREYLLIVSDISEHEAQLFMLYSLPFPFRCRLFLSRSFISVIMKIPFKENRDESPAWNKIKLKAPVIELFPFSHPSAFNVLRLLRMYVLIVIMRLQHVRIVNIHTFYLLVYRPPVALKSPLSTSYTSCTRVFTCFFLGIRNNNNNLSIQAEERERLKENLPLYGD